MHCIKHKIAFYQNKYKKSRKLLPEINTVRSIFKRLKFKNLFATRNKIKTYIVIDSADKY